MNSCSPISEMFSSDNEEETESNEVINDYNSSTSTPAPTAQIEFTPVLVMASTPTVLATASTSTPAPIARFSDMFSDISDSEDETESNEAINGALKVRGGN